MVTGAKSVKIHCQSFAINAEVAEITSLSAHADADELISWMAPLRDAPPKAVFITHGESAAALALREWLAESSGINVEIPTDGQRRVLE